MQVTPGDRIGSYEVVAPIGAGGMGEVYRARDARLGREVAIKILPAGFARDADRLQRFEQEARAAGMLNHPNLLTVHELGVHDGAPYIATELLEGETLRERLEDGAVLAPRKAIEIAAQVLHGLAAAHEKGIVHRDLKPENLFLTRDGRVKILDLGLAKLLAGAASQHETTMKMQKTAPGTVMGTVGYMAPEQVRGQEVDARADIFSFGTILYEMLSGRRAFQRDSSVETMNAILKDDPPEIASTGRAIPPALQKIVDHCIEKNASARFQSAKDVAFNLETITTSDSGSSKPLARAPRRRTMAIVTAIAIAFVASAATFVVTRKKAPEQPTLHQLTFRRGTVRSARFAPDGQTIVYGAAWEGAPLRIFQTRANAVESAPVPLPDADILSIATSGEMAVSVGRKFEDWTSYGTLATTSLLGGTPRPLIENVNCADYSPDGKELAVVRRVADQDQIEWPIGRVLLRTSGYFSHLRVSPDGSSIAFLDHPIFSDNRGDVAIAGRDGKKTTLVHDWAGIEGMAWSPDGSEVWFTGDRDGGTGNLELYGVDRRGATRMVWNVPANLTLLDVTRNGRVLLTGGTLSCSVYGLRDGELRERDLSWLTFAVPLMLTPSGSALLMTSFGPGSGQYYSTYLRPLDGSPAVRVGEGTGNDISPDGKWVLAVKPSNPTQVLLHPIGAGSTRVLNTGGLDIHAALFLPDGKIVAGTSLYGRDPRMWVIDPEGGVPRQIQVTGRIPPSEFRVSPDGKLITFRQSEPGPIMTLPIAGGAVQPSRVRIAEGEILGGWSGDTAIYIARRDPPWFRIDKADLLTGVRTHVRDVPMPDPAGSIDPGYVFLSRDAKTSVTSNTRMLTDLFVVDGLR